MFYRNVLWLILYKTYLFCCNLLICLVTMATKRQNLWKKYLKINSSEAVWGMQLNLCRIVSNNILYKQIVFYCRCWSTSQVLYGGWSWHIHSISFYKNIVFYCCCICTLVAVLSFHRLIMGKMKIGFNCSLIAHILTELFLESFVEYSSTEHENFMQITHFDLLPLPLKG